MFGPWWTPIGIKERLQGLKKQKAEYQIEIRNLEELIKSPEVGNYPRRKLEVHNSITRNQYHLEVCKESIEAFQDHLGILKEKGRLR